LGGFWEVIEVMEVREVIEAREVKEVIEVREIAVDLCCSG
jgi:hypothetical protein